MNRVDETAVRLSLEDVHRIFGYTNGPELEEHLRACPRHSIRVRLMFSYSL